MRLIDNELLVSPALIGGRCKTRRMRSASASCDSCVSRLPPLPAFVLVQLQSIVESNFGLENGVRSESMRRVGFSG